MSKYYFQEWKEPLPHCKDCFNFGQMCGTPCTVCEPNEEWNKNWKFYLYLEGEFIVYQKISVVNQKSVVQKQREVEKR
jgi:hypothetical protein